MELKFKFKSKAAHQAQQAEEEAMRKAALIKEQKDKQKENERISLVREASKRNTDMITTLDKLPPGDYLDLRKLSRPVLDSTLPDVAVLQSNSDANQTLAAPQQAGVVKANELITYLLVSPEVYQQRTQMDVVQRLEVEGFKRIVPKLAHRDVIMSLHSRFRNSNGNSNEVNETLSQQRAFALLRDAFKMGTSDVHIETRPGGLADVYYRIHGIRVKQHPMNVEAAYSMANVLYNFESKDASRKGNWTASHILDTSFEVKDEKNQVMMSVRFHSAPIHPQGCFQIVMRLLEVTEKSAGARSIEEIGYTDGQVLELDEMLVGGSGIVLLTGPTNSGKSSSMQSFAQRIFEVRGSNIKIVTVENPVEYVIPSACQMQANENTFSEFLKGTLREDPDAVIIGEIRDAQSASVVKDLVLAGHKIMGTVHVYEAIAAFDRLNQLGVDLDLLCMKGFISGVVFQRLVPVLCPHCSRPYEEISKTGVLSRALEDRIDSVIDYSAHTVRVRVGDEVQQSCPHCNGSGVIGRTPCAEIIRPDEVFLDLIKRREVNKARQYWISEMGKKIDQDLSVSALSHGIFKMRKGLLDPRDVEQSLGLLAKA